MQGVGGCVNVGILVFILHVLPSLDVVIPVDVFCGKGRELFWSYCMP